MPLESFTLLNRLRNMGDQQLNSKIRRHQHQSFQVANEGEAVLLRFHLAQNGICLCSRAEAWCLDKNVSNQLLSDCQGTDLFQRIDS